MNPQSLNPYVYCMNNPMKYIDPDGRDTLKGWAQEYIVDPLLAPILIDTSTYRSTLLSILRVENRMYQLRSKISEINLSGEYEYHKQQYEYWTRKTFRELDPNTWPAWQQDAMLAPIPPFDIPGLLWAYEFYMGKLNWNTWHAAYHITKQVKCSKYGEKYLELIDVLDDLREKLDSFNHTSNDDSEHVDRNDHRRDLVPI